jgi:hypothetical protein
MGGAIRTARFELYVTSELEFRDGHREAHGERTSFVSTATGYDGALKAAGFLDDAISAHRAKHRPLSLWGAMGHILRPIDRDRDRDIPTAIIYDIESRVQVEMMDGTVKHYSDRHSVSREV